MPGPSLTLSTTRIDRPVGVLVRDDDGEVVATQKSLRLALVRCGLCKGRFRVLPSDVLPHKRYGLCVIASLCTAHTLANKSLRVAAWREHTGDTPAHTTLHAWTEGLGAFVLGRTFGTLPGAHPFSAIRAATIARWANAESTAPPPPIDRRRYRSEARHERLAAVAAVLLTASAVLSAAAIDIASGEPALCAWRRLAIAFGAPMPFAFRTGIECTRSERVELIVRRASGLPQPTRGSTCQTRTRSPPSASSRSLRSSTPLSIPPSDGTGCGGALP